MSGMRADGKTPYYFRLKDSSPFAFAGLWERWGQGRRARRARSTLLALVRGQRRRRGECTTGCRSS